MINQRIPKRIIGKKTATWDIETYKWVNFYLGGVYNGKTVRYFTTIKDMVEYQLSSRLAGFYQYAHFGGKFDFNFFLEEFLRNEKFENYELKIIPLSAGLLCFKIKDIYNHVWYFYDSYRLLPMSLKKLTESFDVADKKKELNYDRIRQYKLDTVKSYLNADLIGLYQVIQKFSDWPIIKKVGRMPTIASQALASFKYFLTVSINDMTPSQEQEIRKGYYGGRTEIFKMYAEYLNCYDVNSLYPYVMRQNIFPISRALCFKKKYIKGKLGYYHVDVMVPNIYDIPPIPYKREKRYKSDFSPLLFPVGCFKTYLTSFDIDFIKKNFPKIRIRVISGMYWEESTAIFAEFIDYFNDIKVKSEKGSADYIIAKLLMNSLYGKFATKRDQQVLVSASKDNTVRLISFGDYGIQIKQTTSYSMDYRNYIIPSLSVFVASLARIELAKLLLKCPDVAYCDTDSIFTSKTLPVSNKLGGLKLEYKIKKAIFLLPKCYILKLSNGKIIKKIKGFPPDMISKITFKSFEKALYKDDYSDFKSVKEVFGGFKENIRRGNNIVSMLTKRLTIKKRYDKRLVCDDFSTKPLMIRRDGKGV